MVSLEAIPEKPHVRHCGAHSPPISRPLKMHDILPSMPGKGVVTRDYVVSKSMCVPLGTQVNSKTSIEPFTLRDTLEP